MQVYKNNGLASSIIHELGLQANKSEAVDFYHDRLILSAASAWMHWLAHSQRGPIGFHSQSDGNNVGLFLGALILLCIMGVIIVAIAQTRNQPRRKGRALGSLYLLSLFLGDDHVERD